MRPEVLAGIGGFGALFEIGKRFREPVLVAGTDGVGTKLKLAFALDRHDTVGIDLVAMCVNDILVQGAEPLFFLDYFACGKLDVDDRRRGHQGHRRRLRAGGLRADRRRDRRDARHVRRRRIRPRRLRRRRGREAQAIDGRSIAAGDVLLGLASSGPHSNGYSLIRRIVEVAAPTSQQPIAGVDRRADAGRGAAAPTRIYVKSLLPLIAALPVKGMAHITGGGLTENTHRMFPDHVAARIDARAGRGRRSSTGCSVPATSPTPRCTACSTAASGWSWSWPRSTPTGPRPISSP